MNYGIYWINKKSGRGEYCEREYFTSFCNYEVEVHPTRDWGMFKDINTAYRARYDLEKYFKSVGNFIWEVREII